MAKSKEPVNPFYVLLVLLGVVFVVTTCAYGTMAWRATQPVASYEARSTSDTALEATAATSDNQPLMVLLDKHGIELLGGELLLLALASFGAMGLDSLRTRQAERQSAANKGKDASDDAARPMVG